MLLSQILPTEIIYYILYFVCVCVCVSHILHSYTSILSLVIPEFSCAIIIESLPSSGLGINLNYRNIEGFVKHSSRLYGKTASTFCQKTTRWHCDTESRIIWIPHRILEDFCVRARVCVCVCVCVFVHQPYS